MVCCCSGTFCLLPTELRVCAGVCGCARTVAGCVLPHGARVRAGLAIVRCGCGAYCLLPHFCRRQTPEAQNLGEGKLWCPWEITPRVRHGRSPSTPP